MSDENKTDEQKDPAAKLDALMAEFETLKSENKALKRDQMALMARSSTPAAAPAPPQEPQLDLDGLPDRDMDEKAYNKALQERIAAHNRATWAYYQAQQAHSTSQQGRAQGIVQQFQEKYPGYSIQGAKAVAENVISKLQDRGIDPNVYINANPDVFFEDIVAAYDAEFGKPQPKEPADPKPDPNPAPQVSPEEEFMRTGGIPGGSESGGAPSGGSTKEDPEPRSLGEILDEGRAKTGMFYD